MISTPEAGEGEERKQAGRQQNQGQWNGQQSQTGQYNSKSQNTDSSQKDTIIIVLLVALLVVTSPLWIGFVAGVFGTIIGIFAGLFGISVGGILGGIAMLAVSIGLMVAGRIALGLLSLGVGLLFFTMGILAVVLLVLLCGMFIPWLCRQIKKLWNKMFGKKGVKA